MMLCGDVVALALEFLNVLCTIYLFVIPLAIPRLLVSFSSSHSFSQGSVEEEVTMMVQTVLHILLDCFVNLSDRMEKYSNTIGHCVSVIMALFELMAPKHYHVLRNSLLHGHIPNINLEVREGEGLKKCM